MFKGPLFLMFCRVPQLVRCLNRNASEIDWKHLFFKRRGAKEELVRSNKWLAWRQEDRSERRVKARSLGSWSKTRSIFLCLGPPALAMSCPATTTVPTINSLCLALLVLYGEQEPGHWFVLCFATLPDSMLLMLLNLWNGNFSAVLQLILNLCCGKSSLLF